ncbi:putative transcription factor bHLH041 [Glycine soja]|uniref:Putative transcription factor bHLH041 n=1 Tax=Glycine soja TaxID=3848 RepID=A0A445HE36_GLYSO|nr:putative transcription factor bHLH041 [Glycine soja]RZB71836.1 putative transcription factor bHLH041 [Glycine soja]
MDGVFTLPKAARADFFRSLVQSFGCTYVCLWQYDSNLSNLFFFDGYCDVTNNQPSSYLGSVAERLFHQYRALTFDVNHECVPGVAFRNQLPYIELQLLDLLRLTSTEIQTQFFQEARIEIAVFMGCKNGEIELGFSNISQVIKKTILPSSSFCFMSLSTGSPDQCSSSLLLSSIPGTSQFHFPQTLPTQTHQQQSIQEIDLAPVIPSYFPTPDGEHEAIVRALMSVMSPLSSSSSTSQQHQPRQILPNYTSIVHPGATAFNTYRPDTMNPNITPYMGSNFRRQSPQNRSFAFFTNLNLMRMRELVSQPASRPISTQHQQHHMITERRRREKLNESFQALRALLPPGTKKAKGTILTTAKDTMRSLMDEIEKINLRNQQLMAVLSAKETTVSATSTKENKAKPSSSSSNERLNVLVSAVLESSSLSEERMVDVQVTLRGESSRVDVLIRLLEFLERVQNVNLVSMYANNHIIGGTTINQLTFRLRIIEGNEWDEHALEEAVRRVVADTIQWKPLDQ